MLAKYNFIQSEYPVPSAMPPDLNYWQMDTNGHGYAPINTGYYSNDVQSFYEEPTKQFFSPEKYENYISSEEYKYYPSENLAEYVPNPPLGPSAGYTHYYQSEYPALENYGGLPTMLEDVGDPALQENYQAQSFSMETGENYPVMDQYDGHNIVPVESGESLTYPALQQERHQLMEEFQGQLSVPQNPAPLSSIHGDNSGYHQMQPQNIPYSNTVPQEGQYFFPEDHGSVPFQHGQQQLDQKGGAGFLPTQYGGPYSVSNDFKTLQPVPQYSRASLPIMTGGHVGANSPLEEPMGAYPPPHKAVAPLTSSKSHLGPFSNSQGIMGAFPPPQVQVGGFLNPQVPVGPLQHSTGSTGPFPHPHGPTVPFSQGPAGPFPPLQTSADHIIAPKQVLGTSMVPSMRPLLHQPSQAVSSGLLETPKRWNPYERETYYPIQNQQEETYSGHHMQSAPIPIPTKYHTKLYAPPVSNFHIPPEWSRGNFTFSLGYYLHLVRL